MPTLFCCILNCEIEALNNKKRKIFYRLPQNIDRKQLWLSQIGNNIKYGTISANSRICNAHFATGKPHIDSSHVDHVPTIFPWSSKDDKAKSFRALEQYKKKIKDLEQKILTKAFLTASSDSKITSQMSTFEPHDYLNGIKDTETKEEKYLKKTKKEPENDHLTIPQPTILNKVSQTGSVINHNLVSYLISSLTQDNKLTKTNNDQDFHTNQTIDLMISSGHTCPLNLSQSYNKINVEEDIRGDVIQNLLKDKSYIGDQSNVQISNQCVNPIVQNDQISNLQSYKNIAAHNQSSPVLTDDGNCKSCTCTKSSCLKLYCECFASGNLCSTGCSCFNCRNNNNHKEERAKIVSCYLERDPYVFSSKIDNQDIGKKHTKGCNCLKSSCLKNYCECFENKVFCSSLCRCRLCYNNEDHAQRNYREDSKLNTGSHTSDSISVISENSPRDLIRKRKNNIIKYTEAYKDLTSNKHVQDFEENITIKRRQLDVDVATVETDIPSIRNVSSMEIPPVLPQEDDFTEEELALMLKFREQRAIKMESVSPPLIIHSTSLKLVNDTITNEVIINTPITSPIEHIPIKLDSNLLMSISNSLAVTSMTLGGVNSCNSQSEMNDLVGNDILSLLVTQQLMVSQPSSLMPNFNQVIPISFIQTPPQCTTVQLHDSSLLGMISSRPITTIIQSPINCSLSKTKLSTEDYVRRHIEAAEKAVQLDNMRRDFIGTKKAIPKQKAKTDFISYPHKASPSIIVNGKEMGNILLNSLPNSLSKDLSEDFVLFNGSNLSSGTNGYTQDVITSITQNVNIFPHLDTCDWTHGPSIQSKCSPAFTKAVQMMHNSSHKSKGNHNMIVPNTIARSLDYNQKWKDKYKSLRRCLYNMRIELRSIKVHMRADQSKIRRLETLLLHMSNELYK